MMTEALNKNYTATSKPVGINAVKFGLWLIIISICMMFAAFTSAYIVSQAEGNWIQFPMPKGFLFNTIVIVLSSVAMQWAYICAKKDKIGMLKVALFITFALGTAFLIGQWQVWSELVANNVFFGGQTSNPGGSFVYVLTGVHGFHLVTALFYLIIILSSAFKFKVHAKNMLQIEMCATYWHFLGALWIYLYLFLTIYK
jgi:cytochrome c oxidase subunit III